MRTSAQRPQVRFHPYRREDNSTRPAQHRTQNFLLGNRRISRLVRHNQRFRPVFQVFHRTLRLETPSIPLVAERSFPLDPILNLEKKGG